MFEMSIMKVLNASVYFIRILLCMQLEKFIMLVKYLKHVQMHIKHY